MSHTFSPAYLHPLQNAFHPRGLILSIFQINDSKDTDCNHCGFDMTVKNYEDVTISIKQELNCFCGKLSVLVPHFFHLMDFG